MAMVNDLKFQRDAWYDSDAVAAALGVTLRKVRQMVRSGQLKEVARAGKTFHRGDWLNECMSGAKSLEQIDVGKS